MSTGKVRTASLLAWIVFSTTAAAQVVVDNDDGAPAYTETGGWTTSGTAGYNGGTYRFASVGVASTATWTADIVEAGDLEVFVWYIPGSNRATSAKYDIAAADGTHTVYINQTGGGYTWESLGTYPFNTGAASITLDSLGSSGGTALIADAVRFGADEEPPPVPVTEVVAPGVIHATWTLPGPEVVHVLEFDLADPQYTIEMGLSQHKRNFTAKETLTQMAARYETIAEDVIGAVNASFFGTGITILGAVGGRSNVIDRPDDTWGLQQTYVLQQSGEGWAVSDVPLATTTVRFADETVLPLAGYNTACVAGQLTLYTADWAGQTGSTAQGVEVIVEDVNYPIRANKDVVGTITAVRTGSSSLNNAIPQDGFVLAACSGAEPTLLPHVAVGEQVTVRVAESPAQINNAQVLVTGNVWMVKDGQPWQWAGPERHPRTVVAWSGTKHWFVTFDGRQPGYSVGASVAEMTAFLIDYLHVDNAINLDGGGSTTMVIHGAVVNCPSDGVTTPCTGFQRAIPNALLLLRRDPYSTFPLQDDFASTGRFLSWDDKFSMNDVVPSCSFDPGSCAGGEHALEVKNPNGGFETASTGRGGDRDYAVQAEVYCKYRPEVATNGFERCGIFARDDGNANFDDPGQGGGNCYALTYDSHDGRIRAGVVVDGVFTDFLASAPLFAPSTAWRRFAIAGHGSAIRYYLDDELIADATDGTHARGRCGVGYHEYFADNGLAEGAHLDWFKVYAPFTGDYDNDGDADLADYNVLRFCLKGPAYQIPAGHLCLWADADGDGNVDLQDFAMFQVVFTGSP